MLRCSMLRVAARTARVARGSASAVRVREDHEVARVHVAEPAADLLAGEVAVDRVAVHQADPVLPQRPLGLEAVEVGAQARDLRLVVLLRLQPARAVQGRLDTGDYVAALADDGLFDSSIEAWTLTLSDVPSGSHTMEVEAVDRAGNMTSTKVPVRVP